MKTLYLDCFSGISGDMMIGALLDLGLPFDALKRELERLGVCGYRLDFGAERDGALCGTHFMVELPESDEHAHVHTHPHSHETVLPHVHTHEDSHLHGMKGESSGQDDTHHVHRTHAEIRTLIDSSSLAVPVKTLALRMFQRLAEAEGKIHGIPTDQVAFHEVGAIDSIVDIVGTCIGIHLLDVDSIRCSPLPLGRGMVTCQHGRLPLPAPATLELLAGIPVYDSGREGELVTPTGAVIAATLSSGFGGLSAMVIERVGYGLGKRRGGATPNALRLVLGEEEPAPILRGLTREKVKVVEANIDDMNPQFFDPLVGRLLASGALDVGLSSILMKKGRPGVKVQVVCNDGRLEEVVKILLSESTTLGVRYYAADRTCLERRIEEVSTHFGPIRVKKGVVDQAVWNVMPEFEDCREAAKKYGVPLKQVHQEALRCALNEEKQEGSD